MDWVKTTARRDENHLSFVIWCILYYRFMVHALKLNCHHAEYFTTSDRIEGYHLLYLSIPGVFTKTFISILHQVISNFHLIFWQWMKLLSLISWVSAGQLWRWIHVDNCPEIGTFCSWGELKMSQMSFTAAAGWPKADNDPIVSGRPPWVWSSRYMAWPGAMFFTALWCVYLWFLYRELLIYCAQFSLKISRKTHHSSPVRASYGMSFVNAKSGWSFTIVTIFCVY